MQAVKIVLSGNGGVGKTCLALAYTCNAFPGEYMPTVFDNFSHTTTFGGRTVNVGLWDVAGYEDFHLLRQLSYPQTDVFIICFSVCRRSTFDAVLSSWYPEIKEFGQSPDAKIILVGLKGDIRQSKKYLKYDRAGLRSSDMEFVPIGEAHQLVRKIGAYAYVECSALKNTNISTVFEVALAAHFQLPPGTMPTHRSPSSGFISSLFQKVKGKGKKKKNEDKSAKIDGKKEASPVKPKTTSTGAEVSVKCTTYSSSSSNRFGHAAAYYHNKLYLFGGYRNTKNEFVECPEYWNGEANIWGNMAELTSQFPPRTYPCAALVHTASSPTILIFGGKSNGYMNELLCFTIQTTTLEKIETTGTAPSPRYGMSAIEYQDEMYLFGGYDKDSEPCNDCFRFNLELKQWSKVELTGAVPSPRFFHSATCINDTHTMVIYGGKTGVNALDDMFSINLVTGYCQQIVCASDIHPGPRHNHTCSYVRGELVLIGGIDINKRSTNHIFSFSFKTQQWKKATIDGELHCSHSHTATYVDSVDEVWLCGGQDNTADTTHSTSRLRLTRDTARIFEMPRAILCEVLRHLTPPSLSLVSQVSHQFNELANDKILWNEIVSVLNPCYVPVRDGDPKQHYLTLQHLLWYNDGKEIPVVPPKDYIRYGLPGFTLY